MKSLIFLVRGICILLVFFCRFQKTIPR